MEKQQENIEMVFNRFKELFTERCGRIHLLDLGEDSVRYDFFVAISEVGKLKPSEIQIEFPIDSQSYIQRNNQKSKRKERPVMDLIVNKDDFRFCVEFGLFRQNRNDKGNIDKTAKTMKMIKDMVRLGIYSYNKELKAYFICVADDKILGHQLQSKILGKFPSDYYVISIGIIEKLMESKTPRKKLEEDDFYERFINKFKQMDCSFQAELLFNEEIKAEKINRETRIIIWEITKK